MNKALLLTAVCIALTLPSVSALNCTLFQGDERELCGHINPLEISEDEKTSLMRNNVYGTIENRNGEVNLDLNLENTEVNLNEVYEKKIVTISKFILFFFVNYFAFSLTKSSLLLKWLNVDYLT